MWGTRLPVKGREPPRRRIPVSCPVPSPATPDDTDTDTDIQM